jgi:hypothetical protein
MRGTGRFRRQSDIRSPRPIFRVGPHTATPGPKQVDPGSMTGSREAYYGPAFNTSLTIHRAIIREQYLSLRRFAPMPRFFIDLHDGSQPIRDEVGFDLPDLPAARAKVTRIMSAIARDMLPDVERQDYVACVRDGVGKVIYRARLSLAAEVVD